MKIKSKLVLLNYGAGNMASIRNACDYLQRPYHEITSGPLYDPSDCIFILPGVGSFAAASRALKSFKFDELSYCSPRLIGICLGMQLLFSDSTEGDLAPGLSLIPGNVRAISDFFSPGTSPRIPHVGWQEMMYYDQNSPFSLSPFLPHDFYFVHSYMAVGVDDKNIAASVNYGGISIPSIVVNDSVIGFQFHPEKSGLPGLQLLSDAISYLEFL